MSCDSPDLIKSETNIVRNRSVTFGHLSTLSTIVWSFGMHSKLTNYVSKSPARATVEIEVENK